MGTRAHEHARHRQQPGEPLQRSRPSRRCGEDVQPGAGWKGEGMGTRAHEHARHRQQPGSPLRRSRPSRRCGEDVQPGAGWKGEGMGTRAHEHARHRQQPGSPLQRSRPSRRCGEDVQPGAGWKGEGMGTRAHEHARHRQQPGEPLQNQGRLEDAERMYNRALAGFEKAWGPEHTNTLDTVNNLGLSTPIKAVSKMRRGCTTGRWLERRRHGDPSTRTRSTPSTTWGLLYANQGRLEDAERMYNRALAGFEKAWGPEHTNTLKTPSTTWGLLYKDQGRLEDAERMSQPGAGWNQR
jgi:hypothetical protein